MFEKCHCSNISRKGLVGVTGYLVPKLNRTESQSTANVQTYSDKVATLLPFLDSNRIEASLARWSNSLGKPKPGCLANRRVDFPKDKMLWCPTCASKQTATECRNGPPVFQLQSLQLHWSCFLYFDFTAFRACPTVQLKWVCLKMLG